MLDTTALRFIDRMLRTCFKWNCNYNIEIDNVSCLWADLNPTVCQIPLTCPFSSQSEAERYHLLSRRHMKHLLELLLLLHHRQCNTLRGQCYLPSSAYWTSRSLCNRVNTIVTPTKQHPGALFPNTPWGRHGVIHDVQRCFRFCVTVQWFSKKLRWLAHDLFNSINDKYFIYTAL